MLLNKHNDLHHNPGYQRLNPAEDFNAQSTYYTNIRCQYFFLLP